VNDGVLSAQNARSIFRTALTNKAQGQTMMLGAAIAELAHYGVLTIG
jgi:hypothetical protein